MEQKNLKTSVFSLDTVFCESAEQPIDIDFTLPDYYVDISKILKCRAISRISSKSINGSSAAIEGCVTVTVIYCGNDNCISSYEYQNVGRSFVGFRCVRSQVGSASRSNR